MLTIKPPTVKRPSKDELKSAAAMLKETPPTFIAILKSEEILRLAANNIEQGEEKVIGPILAAKSFDTRRDIANRLRAAYYLKLLMEGYKPYASMKKSDRNLMKACLELLTQGKQAIKIIGCKSARDRTAVLMAAVKTMQENPRAMFDIHVLHAGITQGLQQGQHFRAMCYHVAVVKVNDVRRFFQNKLPEVVQRAIKALKVFSKKLGDYSNKSHERKVVETQKTNQAFLLITKFANKYEEKKPQYERIYHLINNLEPWNRMTTIPTGIKEMREQLLKGLYSEGDNPGLMMLKLAQICEIRLAKNISRDPKTSEFYNLIIQAANLDPTELRDSIDRFRAPDRLIRDNTPKEKPSSPTPKSSTEDSKRQSSPNNKIKSSHLVLDDDTPDLTSTSTSTSSASVDNQLTSSEHNAGYSPTSRRK